MTQAVELRESEALRLPAELFVLPLSESEYLVYAPLRRAALIGNAALVHFLRAVQAGEESIEAAPEIAGLLRNCGMLGAYEESTPGVRHAGPPRPTVATLLLTNASVSLWGLFFSPSRTLRPKPRSFRESDPSSAPG